MKRVKQFKVGDRVKTVKNSALTLTGVVTFIGKGGFNLGFPWEDNTPHYEVVDEKTGCGIIAHPDVLEKV